MSAHVSTPGTNTIQPAFFLAPDDPPPEPESRSLRGIIPPAIAAAAVLATVPAFAHQAAAQALPQPGPETWRPPAAHLLAASQAHDQAYPMYRVHTGQSMSEIALARCRNPADWTGIYAASRAIGVTGRNANEIQPGQMLAISCTYVPASLKYAPAVIITRSYAVTAAYHRPAASSGYEGLSYGHPNYCGDGDHDGWDVNCATRDPAPQQAVYARPAAQYHSTAATYRGSGGCQSHIIANESGGNARAVNPSSGAGGLYQFLPSTWAALGHSGLPQNASVAEQNQAFQQQVAASGYTAWAASGGC